MKPQIIALAIIAWLSTLFIAGYIGWIERGAYEAGKTAIALEKAVQEEAKKQQLAMRDAIIAIEDMAKSEMQTEFITKEVIKYVEKMPDNPVCYGPNELHYVTEALNTP